MTSLEQESRPGCVSGKALSPHYSLSFIAKTSSGINTSPCIFREDLSLNPDYSIFSVCVYLFGHSGFGLTAVVIRNSRAMRVT